MLRIGVKDQKKFAALSANTGFSMLESKQGIICILKAVRQRYGMSQKELAARAGILRQAVYDIESGRYLPNTAVALELAKALGCSVEDLFVPMGIHGGKTHDTASQISPTLDTAILASQTASLTVGRKTFSPLSVPRGDADILIMGCDPALDILCGHLARVFRPARARCLFASSGQALSALSRNSAHLAAIHFHDPTGAGSNAAVVRTRLSGSPCRLVGFSVMEEGLMVMHGNPLHIRSVSDLARPDIRFVNREPGAALRNLLDAKLTECGLSAPDVPGYTSCVYSHIEGAQYILHHAADVALGLRVTAAAFGLDFIPLAAARCDLVLPQTFTEKGVAAALLDVLASARLRREIAAIPGYESSVTGDVVSG